jgi:Ni/Co efflux regulator RcnB
MKTLLCCLLWASTPVLAQTTAPAQSAEAQAVVDKATGGVLPVTDSARAARKRGADKNPTVPGKSSATRSRKLEARQRRAARKS